MAYIALPDGLPGIRGLLAFRPQTAAPIGALTDVVLRGPGPLSLGEREIIAAYVSRLNDCQYCERSHAAIASCHVGSEETVASAVEDANTAPVSDRLRALLALAARVQQSGRNVRPADIARARAAGAADLEIHDTVLIAALFSMFNRYVDGLGTEAPDDAAGYRERARFVADHGYAAVLHLTARIDE